MKIASIGCRLELSAFSSLSVVISFLNADCLFTLYIDNFLKLVNGFQKVFTIFCFVWLSQPISQLQKNIEKVFSLAAKHIFKFTRLTDVEL